MDAGNFRKRVLHKLAEELELPKLAFQVIRRTIAALGRSMGHPKVQGLMRHSRLATIMQVCMKSLEPEVRRAIDSIHDELMATGTDGQTPSLAGEAQRNGGNRATKPDPAMKAESKEQGKEGQKAVLSRGRILLFAGEMRASNFRGDR